MKVLVELNKKTINITENRVRDSVPWLKVVTNMKQNKYMKYMYLF